MNRLTLALAAAFFAALAPSASAAVIEHTASTGVDEEDLIVYTAGKGEANRLTVSATKTTLTFDDPGARITRKRGDLGACKVRSAHAAVCTIDPSTPVIVRLGDRGDRVRFTGRLGSQLGRTVRESTGDAWDLADAHEDETDLAPGQAEIYGGAGNDDIGGTRYGDFVDAGAGRDEVRTGDGRDKVVVSSGEGADRVIGGPEFDTVDAKGDDPVTIDLDENTIESGGETTARLDSIESARGGAGDDTLRGTDESDGLFGDGGNDTIDGRGGDDYLGGDLYSSDFGRDGSRGVDKLRGGPGNDVLDGRDDKNARFTPGDSLDCGDGVDMIVARQDDLQTACEVAAFGNLGDLPPDQDIDREARTFIAPSGHAPDGSPMYEVACPEARGSVPRPPCRGRVQIEEPPADAKTPGRVLGTGAFSIPRGTRGIVTVTLTASPGIVPGPLAVHVLAGEPAGEDGENADFGWQNAA